MKRRTGMVVWPGWVRLAVLALPAVLAVAGCSGGGDPSPAGRGSAAPATSGVASTTASTTASRASGGDPADGTTTTTARAPVRYRFPVAGCRARYGSSHHDYPAADMFTGRGCAFVAPVDGRVDEVTRRDVWDQASDRGADRGGRSVSLVGVDRKS